MSQNQIQSKPQDLEEPCEEGLDVTFCSASLANDVARCNGVGFQEDDGWDWREGCETCLRRTAQRPEQVWMMKPPAIIAFECEFIIPPNAIGEARAESATSPHGKTL